VGSWATADDDNVLDIRLLATSEVVRLRSKLYGGTIIVSEPSATVPKLFEATGADDSALHL
jgi:hypothetical protein